MPHLLNSVWPQQTFLSSFCSLDNNTAQYKQTIDASFILTLFPPRHLLLTPKKQSTPMTMKSTFSVLSFTMSFDRPTFSSEGRSSLLFSSRFSVNSLQRFFPHLRFSPLSIGLSFLHSSSTLHGQTVGDLRQKQICGGPTQSPIQRTAGIFRRGKGTGA